MKTNSILLEINSNKKKTFNRNSDKDSHKMLTNNKLLVRKKYLLTMFKSCWDKSLNYTLTFRSIMIKPMQENKSIEKQLKNFSNKYNYSKLNMMPWQLNNLNNFHNQYLHLLKVSSYVQEESYKTRV